MIRADLLEDAGDSLAPLIGRRQIEGRFMRGLGWLAIERLLWDNEGRVSTKSASSCKLPSWSELPAGFHVSILERATEPDVVFGSKAVGEPPPMLAISVRGALRDAIASFGRWAPVLTDSAAPPQRVLSAIQIVRGAEEAGVNARVGVEVAR